MHRIVILSNVSKDLERLLFNLREGIYQAKFALKTKY